MQKLLVEFLGTFFLVLVVALSGNPLAIGGVLIVLVYMGGYISGAHYNPAVSLGMWLIKKFSTRQLFGYWFVQFLGAICATILVLWITGAGLVPMPGAQYSLLQASVIEAIFTCLLVLVIFAVAIAPQTQGNQYYGLAIGLTIMAAAYAGGPISGGAFNPAVGLGPLLVEWISRGPVGHRWIYAAGPLGGAIVATLLWQVFQTHKA